MTPSAQPTYTEEPCIYVFQRALTASQHLPDVPVLIDNDSDFMLTGIHGSSTGAYTINFRLPGGRLISSAEIANTNMLGTAAEPAAIGPAPIYRAGSIGPALTLTDTSGAGNTLEICFTGVRRLRTG